jgi:hypothetical protein
MYQMKRRHRVKLPGKPFYEWQRNTGVVAVEQLPRWPRDPRMEDAVGVIADLGAQAGHGPVAAPPVL